MVTALFIVGLVCWAGWDTINGPSDAGFYSGIEAIGRLIGW